MDENLKVYIRRLKNGVDESWDNELPATFVGLEEPELRVVSPISVNCSCYLADKELLITLKIAVELQMPCSICNKTTVQRLEVSPPLKAVPIADIPTSMYDISEDIREGIILELPRFVECNNGSCQERSQIETWLAKKERAHCPMKELL